MRPRSLSLLNIGPFAGRAELDFDVLGDIFLIAGKTGSGKSTIFDAICYALYGTLPGGRKGLARKLRSDFAAEDDECSVALVFDLGDKTYRIERKPPRSRRKLRGEGLVEDGEEAVLFAVTAEGLVSLSGKKSEADERVRELVGLSEEEFSKIVLLPQGEFAQFLRQGSTERREVLRKLFPVDVAVRVRELARSKSKEASARLAEAERNVADKGKRFSADAYEENAVLSRSALIKAELHAAEAETRLSLLANLVRLSEAEEAALVRLGTARREADSVRSREADMVKAERTLAESRLARPLAPLAERAAEAGRQAAALEAAALERSREAEAARSRADAIKAEGIETERLDAALVDARSRRPALEEAAKYEGELSADEAALVGLDASLSALASRKTAAETAGRIRKAELAVLRTKADAADRLDAVWESAREAMERAKALKPLAERSEGLAADAADAAGRGKTAEASCLELEARLPVLEAELAALEAERLMADSAVAAAALALQLRKDTPCPVCGSLEHPLPAAAGPSAFGLDRRVEALRKSRDDASRKLAGLQADRLSLRREMERIEREAADIRVQQGRISPETTPPANAAEAGVCLRLAVEALNAATAPRDEARRARVRLSALSAEAESSSEAAAALEKERAGFSERRAVLSSALDGRRDRLAKILASSAGSAEGPPAEGLPDEERPSADQALTSLDAFIAATERALAARKERAEKARDEAAAAEAMATAAAAAAAEARTALGRASSVLSAALAASPFPDKLSLEAALLDAAEEKGLAGTLADWRDERARTEAVRTEAEKAADFARAGREEAVSLARWEGPVESASLKSAQEACASEKAQAASARDEAASALAALEKDKADWEEAEARRRSLAKETAGLKALDDDLSGNNPRKKAFDSWILGLYLAEIAAYATKRLERMSEGRYRLILDADREGGRGLSGLDLAVFDAYTGRERPCATLSGGESFMASISLALGLADSIQARSGGIRLDAVFIDEGFGSLDEASLDKALGILDEIRDHRMVGLVSHVGEMRARIPSRVEIEKTSAGSRIRVEGLR